MQHMFAVLNKQIHKAYSLILVATLLVPSQVFAERWNPFRKKVEPKSAAQVTPPTGVSQKTPQASDRAAPQTPSAAQQKKDLIEKYKKKESSTPASNARNAPRDLSEANLPFGSNIPLPDFSRADGVPGTGTDAGNLAADLLSGRGLHDLNNNWTWKAGSSGGGFKLSDVIGSTTNLSTMQGTLLNAGIAYIAEHPALGGNPNRGFRPEIWPEIARGLLANRLVMHRIGVLGYPQDARLEYIFTGNKDFTVPKNTKREDSKVLYKEAYIALRTTEEYGNELLGPDFLPLGGEDAVMDLEGNTVLRSDNVNAMMHNSKGFEAFHRLGGVTLGRPSEVFDEEAPNYTDEKEAENGAVDSLNEKTALSGCIGNILKLQFKKARDCFQKRRDEAKFKRLANYEVFGEMAAQFEGGIDYENLTDFATAASRGAVAGGVTSALTGATDFGTGVGLGIVVNTMKTAYNKWFKKEVITSSQINSLMSFVKTYTYAPDEYGIIKPGKDMYWVVYTNGTIMRYKRDPVDVSNGVYHEYPVDALGNAVNVRAPFRISETKEMNVLGLLNGPEVMRKKARISTRELSPVAPLNEDDGAGKAPVRSKSESTTQPAAVKPVPAKPAVIKPVPAKPATASTTQNKQIVTLADAESDALASPGVAPAVNPAPVPSMQERSETVGINLVLPPVPPTIDFAKAYGVIPKPTPAETAPKNK